MNQNPKSKCPICGAAHNQKYAPFCSVKCADQDLGNWLTGNYAIPAADDDEDTLDEIEEVDAHGPSGSDRIH